MAEKTVEKTKDTCAHPSCNCAPAADSKFCSTFCEGNSERPDIICGCGHAACATTTYAGASRA